LALLGTLVFQGSWIFIFRKSRNGGFYHIYRFSHFKFQKGMAMMIPDFIPAKMFWVYFTGFLEIAAGIGLMIPSFVK
jgi:uncharacterized membrane protein